MGPGFAPLLGLLVVTHDTVLLLANESVPWPLLKSMVRATVLSGPVRVSLPSVWLKPPVLKVAGVSMKPSDVRPSPLPRINPLAPGMLWLAASMIVPPSIMTFSFTQVLVAPRIRVPDLYLWKAVPSIELHAFDSAQLMVIIW